MHAKKMVPLYLMVLLVAAAGAALSADVKTFNITSGPMGGDWYSLGGAMGEMAKQIYPQAIVTVTTGGAVENIAKVGMGKADVGLTMASLYAEALGGKGAYAEKGKIENLRAVAFLADIPMSFFLVKQDNPITSIDEIKSQKRGIRILTSTKGSSPSVAAERMLGKYGITFDDIKAWGGSVSFVSYAEASNLIKDGHADAWIGPMVSAIVELTTTTKMKMLPIKPDVLNQLKTDHNYVVIQLPTDKYYFVDKETPHMAEAVIVVAQKSLPTDQVYAFTKSLGENRDRIRSIHKTYSTYEPATAWQNVGGPLHPGAEKCYREMGLMK
jgi:hypothetical protein